MKPACEECAHNGARQFLTSMSVGATRFALWRNYVR